jgi:hypothetical protein
VVGGIDVGAVPRLLVEAEGTGDGGEPSPLLAAALEALSSGVRPVPFGALREALDAGTDALAEALVEGFHADRVAFHAIPPPGVVEPGSHPKASALVRSQARPGALLTALTNHVVRINDEPTAGLLSLLDGTRDREAIRREFEAADLGPLSPEALDDALSHFARAMLLVE